MRNACLIASLFILIAANGSVAKQVGVSRSSEQTHFSAEDSGVRNPIAIPRDVVVLLAKDEGVRHELEYDHIPVEKLPMSWFSASAIHLSGSGKADIVVKAEGPLLGANVTRFWVFSTTARGHELVLAAPAHDLVVESTRWKEHRVIELDSMTAVKVSTALYRFNGKQYVKYAEETKPIS